ncbi:hypothetical protein [Streptococcus suis]|uniref:hypothetical protein n=1 Tax=Streptococcus suis TaxID=1307 RepID=UPI0005CDB437|nr:hypothetical protein [Streptococcus suis]
MYSIREGICGTKFVYNQAVEPSSWSKGWFAQDLINLDEEKTAFENISCTSLQDKMTILNLYSVKIKNSGSPVSIYN